MEYKHSDYMTNRDPVLGAIATFDPMTLREGVTRELEAGRREAALELVRRYQRDPTKKYLDREEAIKELGYELILNERPEDGLAVLELNAELHPGSWKVHASLGEASEYLGRGDKALARAEPG